MLALDDPRWSDLRDCHGPATRIPELLRQIRERPGDGELWGYAQGSLCNEGEISPACYAALPHIVDAAAHAAPGDRFDHIAFVAHVTLAAGGPDADCPAFLVNDFNAAIERMKPLAAEALFAKAWDEDESRYLLGACAILMDQPELGGALEVIEELACPNCGEGLDPDAE